MIRIALTVAIVLLANGCRAPMPNMNVLALYSAPRVPAPGTGTYATPPSPYYQPPTTSYPAPGATYQSPAPTYQVPAATTPAIGTGVRSRSPLNSGWTITDGNLAPNVATRQAAQQPTVRSGTRLDSHVQPASFEEVVPTTRPSNSLRLRGMPVNDATRAREPARFTPPRDAIDISQLPRPGQSGGQLVAASTLVAAPRSAGDPSSNSSSAAANWQTRPLGQTTLRVSGR